MMIGLVGFGVVALLWWLINPRQSPTERLALENAPSRIRALEESLTIRDRVIEDDDRVFALLLSRLELAESILDEIEEVHGYALSDELRHEIAVQRRIRSESKKPRR